MVLVPCVALHQIVVSPLPCIHAINKLWLILSRGANRDGVKLPVHTPLNSGSIVAARRVPIFPADFMLVRPCSGLQCVN